MKQKLEAKHGPVLGMVVMRKYRLVRKLGTGAFGDIFLAVNTLKETEKFAAKLEPIDAKHPQLQLEGKLYQLLDSEPCVGFPKVEFRANIEAGICKLERLQRAAAGSAGEKPAGIAGRAGSPLQPENNSDARSAIIGSSATAA